MLIEAAVRWNQRNGSKLFMPESYNDYGAVNDARESPSMLGFFGFDPYEFWAFRLIFILLGYATVVIPCYLLILYIRKISFENDAHFNRGRFSELLRMFAIGNPEYQLVATDHDTPPNKDKPPASGDGAEDSKLAVKRILKLIFCFVGIQLNFVAMGFFQERIITQGYPRSDDGFVLERFGDAQFLVFVNRIVALALCGCYLLYDYRNQPHHVPAFYKYSFCSLSNTLSSWCQYEALKFVSFPTMTVCKASKLLPTMVMGYIVRRKTYSRTDYISALILVSGASLFFLSTKSLDGPTKSVTTISGIILMVGYLVFDAFTPNWQKKLFDCKPYVSKTQMMFGVNSFSAVLCFVSLMEQGTFFSSLSFLLAHDGLAKDAFLLSLSGACGQVFIYVIIKEFGPELLAIIMTLRQIFSIALSAFYFGHSMGMWGVAGLCLVFGSIFYSKGTEIRRKKLPTRSC